MAGKNHVIEIPLMGQKIVLKTQADPKLVEEVTALVKERIGNSEKRVKNANAPHLAALLALFDVAEDYVEAKRKIQEHQSELLAKVSQLQSWVDSALKD
ncbi:MAG: cell division protein ZapA [Bdellovibrionales bacterium]|nr:cell division protein ZapA [Bdellovibrionales bacterium]